MRHVFNIHFLLLLAVVFLWPPFADASISANYSNGAVRVGAASDTCDGTTAGAIRYQSNVLQFCNGTAWGNIATAGTSINMLAGIASAGSVPPSSTYYDVFLANASVNGTEANRTIVVPLNGTAYNLYVTTSNGQPAGGSMVVTLRKNGADTTLTTTIAAGASAGTFSDLTHTVSLSAGDKISLAFTNNASGAGSAGIYSYSMAIQN